MAITPILPVVFDPVQAVALGDGFRDGRILEARITEVMSKTLARIDIDGHALMVTMTKPLPVGAALTLKVEHEAGQLRLIAQGPARDLPETLARNLPQAPIGARAAPLPSYQLTEPVRVALAKMQPVRTDRVPGEHPASEPSLSQILESMPNPEAEPAPARSLRTPLEPGQPHSEPPVTIEEALAKLQAMTVDAAPDEAPAAEPELPQFPGAPARPQADGAPAPRLPPRMAAHNDGAPTATLAAFGEEGDDSSAVRVETPEFRQVHVASDASGAPGRTERGPLYAVEIPVFLPGNNVPLRLHVTEHEEPDRQENGEPRSPYWTVRFAAEAGRLGMVHAAISLIDGHIGVQLHAEQEETAERFKQNAGQLRDALQASDLKLDAVSIGQGGPLRER